MGIKSGKGFGTREMNNLKTEIMESKKNEIIVKTAILEEMRGKYLAERLLRTWNEDFVDDDTAEVVSIERNEIILEKGTLLDSKNISEINFFLQSGDVKEISISNQKRSCFLVKGHATVWITTISLNNKKKNIYLYADSIETAMEITVDFVEQKYEGNFKILGIKQLDFSNLIPTDLKEEDVMEENDYYKTEVEVAYENEEPNNQVFIIKAPNAETAKSLIIDNILNENHKNGNITPFETTIISAKTIPCNDIIDVEFSKSYLVENE